MTQEQKDRWRISSILKYLINGIQRRLVCNSSFFSKTARVTTRLSGIKSSQKLPRTKTTLRRATKNYEGQLISCIQLSFPNQIHARHVRISYYCWTASGPRTNQEHIKCISGWNILFVLLRAYLKYIFIIRNGTKHSHYIQIQLIPYYDPSPTDYSVLQNTSPHKLANKPCCLGGRFVNYCCVDEICHVPQSTRVHNHVV
jgi:hypothetical protein